MGYGTTIHGSKVVTYMNNIGEAVHVLEPRPVEIVSVPWYRGCLDSKSPWRAEVSGAWRMCKDK